MRHPCRKDGFDCPRRKCGYAATCPEWAEWVKWREMTREQKRTADVANAFCAKKASETIDRAAKYRINK